MLNGILISKVIASPSFLMFFSWLFIRIYLELETRTTSMYWCFFLLFLCTFRVHRCEMEKKEMIRTIHQLKRDITFLTRNMKGQEKKLEVQHRQLYVQV